MGFFSWTLKLFAWSNGADLGGGRGGHFHIKLALGLSLKLSLHVSIITEWQFSWEKPTTNNNYAWPEFPHMEWTNESVNIDPIHMGELMGVHVGRSSQELCKLDDTNGPKTSLTFSYHLSLGFVANLFLLIFGANKHINFHSFSFLSSEIDTIISHHFLYPKSKWFLVGTTFAIILLTHGFIMVFILIFPPIATQSPR